MEKVPLEQLCLVDEWNNQHYKLKKLNEDISRLSNNKKMGEELTIISYIDA